MRGLILSFGLLAVSVAVGCDPGTSIQITDVHSSRVDGDRVAVDVELVAAEATGNNIGTYCTRVTFVGQPTPSEQCNSDMKDGDTKTVRFVSDGRVDSRTTITIRVRLGNVDVGRSFEAP